MLDPDSAIPSGLAEYKNPYTAREFSIPEACKKLPSFCLEKHRRVSSTGGGGGGGGCRGEASPPNPQSSPPKLLTCQYKVPTKVGVVKDSEEFFPPKQKILDETLACIILQA